MHSLSVEKTTRKDINSNVNLNIKKRRGYGNKVKVTTSSRQVKRDTVTLCETKVTTTKSECVTVSTISSLPFVSENPRNLPLHRGKCLYQSRKCENERALKRNGKPHNLCEAHRNKQNQHQRKFDAKKFLRKRQRDSVKNEDVKSTEKILPLHRNDECISKRHRVMVNQETKVETLVEMTNLLATTPVGERAKGNNPLEYEALPTSISAGMTRLPPVHTPQRRMSSTTLDILYGSVRPSIIPEGHLRGHVGLSGYRREPGGQSICVSHRPNLQQHVAKSLAGYTHLELAAASVLTQQQPYCFRAAQSTLRNIKTNGFAARSSQGTTTTPRLLPSLLVPPSAASSSSLYPRVSGIMSCPAASVSFCSARSDGKALPSLVSFGRRMSPASPLLLSKQSK